MLDPEYRGPWPPGSLVASSPQGKQVATWGGQAWQLAGGGTAPAGGLSRALGYTPTVQGAGSLVGVYWDTSTGSYRRMSADRLAEAQYTDAAGNTVGGVAGLVGGAYGGQAGAQAGLQLGQGLLVITKGIEGAVS